MAAIFQEAATGGATSHRRSEATIFLILSFHVFFLLLPPLSALLGILPFTSPRFFVVCVPLSTLSSCSEAIVRARGTGNRPNPPDRHRPRDENNAPQPAAIIIRAEVFKSKNWAAPAGDLRRLIHVAIVQDVDCGCRVKDKRIAPSAPTSEET
jgi:hypothetical protein